MTSPRTLLSLSEKQPVSDARSIEESQHAGLELVCLSVRCVGTSAVAMSF